MNRNWGMPPRPDQVAFRSARSARPLATLGVTAIYGVIGAAAAAISFNDARQLLENLFHGRSLVMAVIAAGFGCWAYVWLARPRFAAHFTGASDAFSVILRSYAIGALGLVSLFLIAKMAEFVLNEFVSVIVLCCCGGAGAAAAFQTVLAFVPGYETSERR